MTSEYLALDFTSRAHVSNPQPLYENLWQAGPVVPVKLPIFGRMWMTTSYESSAEMLKNSELFSRQPERAGLRSSANFMWWIPRSLRAFAKNMMMLDEPEHRRLRSTVDQAFARRDIKCLAEKIEATAHELLDQLEKNNSADLIGGYCRELPIRIICDLLGIHGAWRTSIQQQAQALTTATSSWHILRAVPNFWRMKTNLLKLFEEQERTPSDGLISLLLHPPEGEERLSSDELLSMVFILFVAGHETTTHLISGAIVDLLTHPEQKQLLLHDPDRMGLAIEEFLRYCAPVQMTKPRFVTKTVNFHGVELERGTRIMAHIGASNRDPAKHVNASEFDISRKPNPHLSFSTGIHFCLGHQLARLETEIALNVLFTRYPNLHLAIAREQLPWRRRLGLRALERLPVNLA